MKKIFGFILILLLGLTLFASSLIDGVTNGKSINAINDVMEIAGTAFNDAGCDQC